MNLDKYVQEDKFFSETIPEGRYASLAYGYTNTVTGLWMTDQRECHAGLYRYNGSDLTAETGVFTEIPFASRQCRTFARERKHSDKLMEMSDDYLCQLFNPETSTHPDVAASVKLIRHSRKLWIYAPKLTDFHPMHLFNFILLSRVWWDWELFGYNELRRLGLTNSQAIALSYHMFIQDEKSLKFTPNFYAGAHGSAFNPLGFKNFFNGTRRNHNLRRRKIPGKLDIYVNSSLWDDDNDQIGELGVRRLLLEEWPYKVMKSRYGDTTERVPLTAEEALPILKKVLDSMELSL
jgi:hypothetical protein